jgi:hypothetical protein
MAAALDDLYRPIEVTDTYHPGDTFFASVEISDYRGGKPLIARWFYYGMEIDTSAYEGEQVGSGYVGFTLNSDLPWQVGDYRIDILYDDKLLNRADFTVVAEPSDD